MKIKWFFGAGSVTRTRDLRITIVVRHLTKPCKSRVLATFSDATMPFVAQLFVPNLLLFDINYVTYHQAFRLTKIISKIKIILAEKLIK